MALSEVTVNVFLAGIMQGSMQGRGHHDQRYRQEIAALIKRHLPQAEIVDPWALYPDSASYDDERARETFFRVCELVGQADLMIAYLPEASIGTGVEMWEAHRRGVPIISVSPLEQNWAIRFLSWRVCRTLEELALLLQQARLPARSPARPKG